MTGLATIRTMKRLHDLLGARVVTREYMARKFVTCHQYNNGKGSCGRWADYVDEDGLPWCRKCRGKRVTVSRNRKPTRTKGDQDAA